jgi:hypothetical protein
LTLHAVPSGLAGVVARVKLGEADLAYVEAEAGKNLRGTRGPPSEADLMTKQQLDEILESAEEHLNTAVVDLKGVLGEGCPWVGAVVRRLAGLHHIKGDPIMAEGLYGGGLGRLDAIGSIDIPAALRAEHVLLLEGNASLVRKLTWNGAARIPEAKKLVERAEGLRAGLPGAPAELAMAMLADCGGVGVQLLEPIDWLAVGWRVDTWSAAEAWSGFE